MLRATGAQLLQTGGAAGLAWYLAHDALGHRNAFFAPIAAVIALGVVPGNHTRRAIEIVLGVGVGIAVGDLLISAIGHGPGQVALVVLLAMAGAILLGGGALLVTQAGASGVLVATVATSTHGVVPTRFVDALVGGAVGLAVLAVFPRDPARIARRAAGPVFAELAAVLEDVAKALEERDLAAVTRALVRARGLDDLAGVLREALQLAEESVRLAPLVRHERGRIDRYATAALHLGFAIRNTRVLARAALRAVELEPSIPTGLVASIHELGVGARRLEAALELGEGGEGVAEAARRAAATATRSFDEDMGFAIGALVGQVRSIAADLLRALGLERADAVGQVRAAAEA